MIEIDGPARAWFEDKDGNRYEYIVHAFMAKTPKECMDAYANWYYHASKVYAYIVWRSRPKLQEAEEIHPDAEWGVTEYRPACWKITWRWYGIYRDEVSNAFPSVKNEGEPIPYTEL